MQLSFGTVYEIGKSRPLFYKRRRYYYGSMNYVENEAAKQLGWLI